MALEDEPTATTTTARTWTGHETASIVETRDRSLTPRAVGSKLSLFRKAATRSDGSGEATRAGVQP